MPGFEELSPAQTQNSAPRNSPCQPGGRRALSLRGHDAPICRLRPCRSDKDWPRKAPLRGPMPFFLWKGELSVKAIPASGSAVRSRERVFFLSAPVASAWDPGRSRAQAAHPRRRLCSTRPAGGAAPPFGARLTAAALPAPLPGRPLRPRWEAGGRGPSRQPQLQPVFVASARLPARPPLAALGFAQRWRVRLLRGLHAPAAARAPRPACTGPRRLQKAAQRTNRPLLLLLRAPGVGGGEAGEQRQRQPQRAAEAGMQPRGPWR